MAVAVAVCLPAFEPLFALGLQHMRVERVLCTELNALRKADMDAADDIARLVQPDRRSECGVVGSRLEVDADGL